MLVHASLLWDSEFNPTRVREALIKHPECQVSVEVGNTDNNLTKIFHQDDVDALKRHYDRCHDHLISAMKRRLTGGRIIVRAEHIPGFLDGHIHSDNTLAYCTTHFGKTGWFGKVREVVPDDMVYIAVDREFHGSPVNDEPRLLTVCYFATEPV